MEKIFYFAQVFNGINTLSIILIVVSIVSIFILGSCLICEISLDEDIVLGLKRALKHSIITCIIGALGLVFCPTKQTYLFMVGGRVVNELVENNPTIKEIPGNTIDLLNEYIKLETEKIRNKRE